MRDVPTKTRPVLLHTSSQASTSEFQKKKKRTKKSERRKKNDARPVGARRPRYAASGDVGEGEGGSEPNERSCGAEGDDCDGDVGDARKLVNASE